MKKILLSLTGMILLFCSCSNTAHFDEQYKQILYIVNSKELYKVEHEAVAKSKGCISVYCTGSKMPSEDIHISYKVDAEALDQFNRQEYGDKSQLYFARVPDELITFANQEIVVPKGQEYGTLNFEMNTLEFAPDKMYVLPLTITGVPDGYEISEEMHTIYYMVNVSNDYAGVYSSSYKENGVAKGIMKKTLQAVARKQLLLPLAGKNESIVSKPLSYETDYYLLTINEDNTLTVNPYLQSVIHPNPDKVSYYDPELKIFFVHYFVEDQYGTYIEIEEVMSEIY